MATRVVVIDGIIAAVAILVQAVGGLGIEIRSVIGGNEASPFGAVISGIAVVQAGFFVVVIATVTDGVGVCYGNVGSIAGNGAIAPGIVDISGDQSTAGACTL